MIQKSFTKNYLCMNSLFGEYGEPIIKKIEESFLTNLIYPINEETNLIWMMCAAPICPLTNGWIQNEKYRAFLRKKQNLTDVIAFIGYQSCIGTCDNLFYSKQINQNQGLIEEFNKSNEYMEYLQINNVFPLFIHSHFPFFGNSLLVSLLTVWLQYCQNLIYVFPM